MPKEIAHWILAEYMAMRLPADNPVMDAIRAYPAAYYIGAVMIDSPFYSRHIPEILFIGSLLHAGRDEHELTGLISLGTEYDHRENKCALAFIAGVITHRIADSIFHPLVFSYCGHSGSRHHRFEVMLDIYFLNHYRQQYGKSFFRRHVSRGRLYRLIAVLQLASSNYLPLLARFYASAGQLPTENTIGDMLTRHARIQRMLLWRPVCILAHGIAILWPSAQSNANLCYPINRRRKRGRLTNTIEYIHPQTGKHNCTTLTSMIEQAVTAGHRRLGDLAHAAASSRSTVAAYLQQLPRISLAHGMSHDIPMDLSYWFDAPLAYLRNL